MANEEIPTRRSRLFGGQATRAEVYVIAIVILVLGFGSVGGAIVVSNSGGGQEGTVVESDQTTATSAVNSPTGDASTGNDAVDTSSPIAASPSTVINGQVTPGANSADETAPTTTTQYTTTTRDPKYLQPFIGDARTLSYLGAGYICAWDFQALGGWGWGFDPNEPCNRQFEAYIASHCGVRGDQPWYPGSTGPWTGTIFSQRCDEWEARDLPIYYG